MLYASWGLVKNMLEAVAVQKGIMIISENRYFDLIQDSVGRDSEWTRAFRTAWGLDPNGSQYSAAWRRSIDFVSSECGNVR